MSITVSEFGKMKDGSIASLYVLKNGEGMTATVSDLGAVLVSLYVRDRDGQFRDVVLGFDDVESYEEKNDTFYGATIGRCGNRIGKASCLISGTRYTFDKNDGNNNLHGGFHGYQIRLWQVKDRQNTDTPSITFALRSPHLDQGFPGNADILVTYRVTADNELEISYDCVADRDTIFNLTNHSYFNLNGHDSGTVLDQEVKINSDRFTWADRESIPTGEITKVEGTPMDFREFHTIGERIEEDYQALPENPASSWKCAPICPVCSFTQAISSREIRWEKMAALIREEAEPALRPSIIRTRPIIRNLPSRFSLQESIA